MKKDILRFIKKHTPTVLCILSAGGVAVTAVLAVKCSTKASELISKAEQEKGEELTVSEKVKVSMPAYIPAVISGAVTVACIFGANVLNKKQQASLASAYALLNNSCKRYTDKVKETYGDEAHNAILNSIAVEKAEDVNVVAPTITGAIYGFDGSDEKKMLFYDGYSQRYFESTISQVLQAEYHLNRNFCLGGDVTLNDFYLFLGLENVDGGDDVGWFWHSYEMGWIDFENRPMKLDDGTKFYLICSVFEPTLYEPSDE